MVVEGVVEVGYHRSCRIEVYSHVCAAVCWYWGWRGPGAVVEAVVEAAVRWYCCIRTGAAQWFELVGVGVGVGVNVIASGLSVLFVVGVWVVGGCASGRVALVGVVVGVNGCASGRSRLW